MILGMIMFVYRLLLFFFQLWAGVSIFTFTLLVNSESLLSAMYLYLKFQKRAIIYLH